MKATLSRVRWDLVVKTAVLVYIVTFILGLALSVPLLALLNWGRLDSDSAFLASSVISAFFVFVVTGYGALRVARRVESAALVHGQLRRSRHPVKRELLGSVRVAHVERMQPAQRIEHEGVVSV